MDGSILHNNDIVRDLSNNMKKYFGSSYCTLVTSGTVAIKTALKALELPHGSKVLVPDISFIATASAVADAGLVPVFADCSPKTWGQSYETVKSTTEAFGDIKAVITVHFAGIVNRDIVKTSEFCRKNSIYLIEDCAQVFGGGYMGKKCGTIGDIGVFSFQSSKVITCGEGGMILTDSKKISDNAERLINWGLDSNSERKLDLPCGNYRINQFGAAFLNSQLENAEEIIDKRIKLYKTLEDAAVRVGLELQFKAENADFKDIPFFMLVKSSHPTNFLHPLGEYPMHLSVLVKSIISKMHPDLLPVYEQSNAGRDFSNSVSMVSSTDFVPLFGLKDDYAEKLVKSLLEPA